MFRGSSPHWIKPNFLQVLSQTFPWGSALGSVRYGCGTFPMLHTLCPFFLLEVYLFTNQKSPLTLELVNLSAWIFSLYPMSHDQFSIFGFGHVVEVFGRSCVTNIVLFSGPWTNTSKLATRVGSFFGQARAVNTNHVWSWRRHGRKCRTKRRTSTRVKPSEKWQIRFWERTGSYTPNSWVFIFSQMEARGPKRRRPYF